MQQPLFIDDTDLARCGRPRRHSAGAAHHSPSWQTHVPTAAAEAAHDAAGSTLAALASVRAPQAWPELLPLVPSIESVFLRQRRSSVATGIWEARTGRLIAFDAPFAALLDLACNPALSSPTGVRWTEFGDAAAAALSHLPALALSVRETVARIAAFAAQLVCHTDELRGVHLVTKLGRIMTCNVRLLLSQSHLYPGEVFVVWFVDSVGVYPLLLPQLLNLRAVEQFTQNAQHQWPQPQRY